MAKARRNSGSVPLGKEDMLGILRGMIGEQADRLFGHLNADDLWGLIQRGRNPKVTSAGGLGSILDYVNDPSVAAAMSQKALPAPGPGGALARRESGLARQGGSLGRASRMAGTGAAPVIDAEFQDIARSAGAIGMGSQRALPGIATTAATVGAAAPAARAVMGGAGAAGTAAAAAGAAGAEAPAIAGAVGKLGSLGKLGRLGAIGGGGLLALLGISELLQSFGLIDSEAMKMAKLQQKGQARQTLASAMLMHEDRAAQEKAATESRFQQIFDRLMAQNQADAVRDAGTSAMAGNMVGGPDVEGGMAQRLASLSSMVPNTQGGNLLLQSGMY